MDREDRSDPYAGDVDLSRSILMELGYQALDTGALG